MKKKRGKPLTKDQLDKIKYTWYPFAMQELKKAAKNKDQMCIKMYSKDAFNLAWILTNPKTARLRDIKSLQIRKYIYDVEHKDKRKNKPPSKLKKIILKILDWIPDIPDPPKGVGPL